VSFSFSLFERIGRKKMIYCHHCASYLIILCFINYLFFFVFFLVSCSEKKTYQCAGQYIVNGVVSFYLSLTTYSDSIFIRRDKTKIIFMIIRFFPARASFRLGLASFECFDFCFLLKKKKQVSKLRYHDSVLQQLIKPFFFI
jgi:hypothetical protein